jgi:SAM-dependent methyltransferase
MKPRLGSKGGPVEGDRSASQGRARDQDVVSEYERRWGATTRVVQVRPHLWRELGPALAGKTVLEIGPGLRPAAPLDATYFVERSSAAVATLSRAGGRAVQASGASLPFRAQSFDAVLAFEVLEHIEEDQHVLDEMARVLRPGGIVAVSVPLHAALWSELDEACAHVRRYEPGDLWGKLRKAGMEPERYQLHGSFRRAAFARARRTMLVSTPRASNALLQTVVFPCMRTWHRLVGRYEWNDGGEPIENGGSGVTVLATLSPQQPPAIS